MDFKVDVGNVLPGSHEATSNAARWLRGHLDIPENRALFDEYEEYFNCRVVVENRRDYWMEPDKIVFESSADLTAFLLRWS